MESTDDEINKIIDKKIAKIIFEVHAYIVANTPVDTGRLRNSIVIEQDDDGNWFIGTNVPYAEEVEIGQPPHKIVPVKAKALRFKIGNKVIYAKSVQHPGTKGAGMFKRGISFAEKRIKEEFSR